MANVLVGATPAVFLTTGAWASETVGGSTDSAMGAAVPVTLVYLAVAIAFLVFCERRTRRALQQIREFDAPEVLRSRLIGADRSARRLIAQAEARSVGEQRQLLDILWRLAQAEQARTEYLDSVETFDEEAFAPYLRAARDAEADLRSWSMTVSPR